LPVADPVDNALGEFATWRQGRYRSDRRGDVTRQHPFDMIEGCGVVVFSDSYEPVHIFSGKK
jgi:hypothetical protein